jgi:hypothetical protein
MRETRPEPTAGLCTACRHARQVTSARLSTFVRCALSATDSRFPKYPRLPVVCCDAFRPVDSPEDQGHQR